MNETKVIMMMNQKGGVELISGHRRWTAAKMAGITEIPGIIKNLDDDDAIIFMNDTNLKREYISPMERAFSYKARYEAMDRKQLKLGFKEVGEKMNARAKMAEEVGDSETNINLCKPKKMITNKNICDIIVTKLIHIIT